MSLTVHAEKYYDVFHFIVTNKLKIHTSYTPCQHVVVPLITPVNHSIPKVISHELLDLASKTKNTSEKMPSAMVTNSQLQIWANTHRSSVVIDLQILQIFYYYTEAALLSTIFQKKCKHNPMQIMRALADWLTTWPPKIPCAARIDNKNMFHTLMHKKEYACSVLRSDQFLDPQFVLSPMWKKWIRKELKEHINLWGSCCCLWSWDQHRRASPTPATIMFPLSQTNLRSTAKLNGGHPKNKYS